MSDELWIPPKTRERLEAPAIKGSRHSEMTNIACSLSGQGFAPEAIFWQLRRKYPEDVPDSEIEGVVKWAMSQGFTKAGGGLLPSAPQKTAFVPLRNGYKAPEAAVTASDPIQEAERFLRGRRVKEATLRGKGEELPDWSEHFTHLLCCCYELHESVNVVTKYGERDGKAQPSGTGDTLTIEEWIERVSERPFSSPAGGWMRMNPVEGGVSDSDVTAYRFILLENDVIPADMQLSLLCRLALPVSAIIWSGGVSYHAWVRVDCPSVEVYRSTSLRLLSLLQRFGFDQANKNPSRLSRLPGVERKIGVKTDGRQRLVYLNPNPTSDPIL
ncbi:MAG TPA: hypothetical protein VKZ59_16575 [Acidobacteriota bacterium]|nr:hypothetical protein [Acidobacteriota bacterium]